MGVLFRLFSIFPSWSNAEVLFLKNNTSFLQALIITHWVFTWTWSSLMCYKIPTQRFICSLKMWFVSYETKCCCFIPSLLVTWFELKSFMYVFSPPGDPGDLWSEQSLSPPRIWQVGAVFRTVKISGCKEVLSLSLFLSQWSLLGGLVIIAVLSQVLLPGNQQPPSSPAVSGALASCRFRVPSVCRPLG